MAGQEKNGIEAADTSIRAPEDRSFDGSDRNPIVSNGVGKVEERAECENLGISSCTIELEMRSGPVPIPMESARVVKLDGEVCENLGISSCTVEQEMRNGAEPIAIESTRVVNVDGQACESLGVSGCDIEEGMGSISLVGGLQSSEQEMRNGAEPITMESSTSVVKVDGEVRENLVVSGCNIDEGMESINLVSVLGSSVIIGENDGKCEIKMDEDESDSSESEGDNPSSPTSSSSSSSSDSDDSSTSGGSSDNDDSEDNEEEEQQEEEKMTEKIEAEVEEGEIKDSDGQELVTDTVVSADDDHDEDGEGVTWRGINDEDDEDDTATEGPIRSKNELKVILYFKSFTKYLTVFWSRT